jgi:hypothetical protein
MTEREISPQLSDISDGQRNAKWTRVCAIAILAISIAYALMLPSGGLYSMSYDGFRYLAGADSILASGSYLDISGAPQSHWPPGTSILYAAAASLSGRPPEELVKFLNLAALLLMAGSLWLIIATTIERWWIAVITFASILLNTSILSLQNKFWSDPLALATSSAAIASGIVACRAGKNWFGWICVASVFLSISICFRYAMSPAIPILALAALWLSKRSSSHRGAVFLPLLLPPLLLLISFYFVRPSNAPHLPFSIRTVNSIGSFDFKGYWKAFAQMADQVIPNALFATWLSMILVGTILIAVPIGVTFVAQKFQQRGALLICVGYVLVSCVFLALVPVISTFSFGMDYRYLLPIYPFILIGSAIAANVLLNRQQLSSRILSLIIVALLSIAAARSTRAAVLGILSNTSQQSASCVSGEALVDDLKRIPATQNPSGALTNIQALSWYAMRIPTADLTWRALADARSGTIIIFARPEFTCPEVVEHGDISEMALTSSSDVRIVSSSGALLIGRKQ